MIVSDVGGYALRCTGCRAFVELTRREAKDAYLRIERQDAMRQAHDECDTYQNAQVAAAAIKLSRSLSRAGTRQIVSPGSEKDAIEP